MLEVFIAHSHAADCNSSRSILKVNYYVTGIVDHLDNLLQLIDSLMTMSELDKATAINLSETGLNDLLGMVVEQGHEQANGRALTIEMLADETLPTIEADKEKLSKVFSSIMSNAIHYTPDHGRIVVRAYEKNDGVVIEISDNGIGMSEEVQADIFKRFYRADDAHTTSGFGLGLSIAQRIIELHHGRIEVESAPEQGSTFRVILPHPA